MKNNLNLEMGERVRKARMDLGLTREQLSEMLGISSLFLGYIECGQRGMSMSTLQNMCETLNVSADYILFGRENVNELKDEIIFSLNSIEKEYLPLLLDNINNFKRTIAIAKHIDK